MESQASHWLNPSALRHPLMHCVGLTSRSIKESPVGDARPPAGKPNAVGVSESVEPIHTIHPMVEVILQQQLGERLQVVATRLVETTHISVVDTHEVGRHGIIESAAAVALGASQDSPPSCTHVWNNGASNASGVRLRAVRPGGLVREQLIPRRAPCQSRLRTRARLRSAPSSSAPSSAKHTRYESREENTVGAATKLHPRRVLPISFKADSLEPKVWQHYVSRPRIVRRI
jgi:hypothetical protein